MIVKTAWPALIPAIEKAGHVPYLVSVEHFKGQVPTSDSISAPGMKALNHARALCDMIKESA